MDFFILLLIFPEDVYIIVLKSYYVGGKAMITYHTLKREAIIDGYCRNCLNSTYGLALIPSDCIYNAFPGECCNCKKVSHIIAKLRISGQFKLLKAHKQFAVITSE